MLPIVAAPVPCAPRGCLAAGWGPYVRGRMEHLAPGPVACADDEGSSAVTVQAMSDGKRSGGAARQPGPRMLDPDRIENAEQFGHAPRQPGDEPPSAPLFREAMSRVAGAVHVVTTDGAAGAGGFTATAFTGVSDAPPTVLVCLNTASRILPVIETNGVFCVNTLRAADEELADVFAGRTGLYGPARFGAGVWASLATGAPALASALSAFDCRLIEAKTVATHRIFIGEVVGVRLGGSEAGLVYRNRSYRPV